VVRLPLSDSRRNRMLASQRSADIDAARRIRRTTTDDDQRS
jgi:hypothetical protein